MKVSVNRGEGLACEVLVTIPASDIDSKVDARMQQTAKQVTIKGFRPGKVPLKLVKERFGDAVRAEVVNEQLQNAYFKAVDQEKLRPAGLPEVEIKKDEAGTDLEFVAKIELFPEVKLKDLDKIEIEKPAAKVEDGDLDTMMETLQKQHADWKEAKREAKDGDQVTVDFVGTMEGESFDGGTGEGMTVTIGAGQMIDGFEKGLEGKKAGDKTTLKLKFPDNYHADHLAGKPVEFAVTVQKVEEPELPKLDKKFAEKFNVDSIAQLKKDVRANMERELDFAIKGRVKTQVIDQLLKTNDVDVPEALLQQEINNLKNDSLHRMGLQNKGQQLPELPDDLFKDQALRRVKLGLLMGTVINDNDIKADEKRVKEMVEKLTAVYEDSDAAAAEMMRDENQMAELRQAVIEEGVIDKIMASAKVTDKPMSFQELLGGATVGA